MAAIDKREVGINIRRIMDKKGFSVKDVREHLELESEQSIYAWMNGRNLPTTDKLFALSQMFGVPMDEIICGKKRRFLPFDECCIVVDTSYDQRLRECERKLHMFSYYFRLEKLKRAKELYLCEGSNYEKEPN